MKKLLLVFVLSFVSTLVVHAQENSVSANVPDTVYAKKELVEVSIQAMRPVTAASASFLSAKDFDNRPRNSAQDMLRIVPGLFIAQHAGGGKAEQIFIRGFDCDHGTDIALFADGIPVNMPSHAHGQGYADLHFIIPETVRGMDVFKGPYSPYSGDFATGASVQYKTLDTLSRNLFQMETSAFPTLKKWNGSRALFMYQLPISSSKFKSYVAADYSLNRGYFNSPQHFDRLNLFSNTIYTINDREKIKFTLSHFTSSWDASGQIPERAVNNESISRFGSIDSTEGGITGRDNVNIMYTKQTSKGEFQSQLYASRYRFNLFSNFTFFLNDPLNGDEIEQRDDRILTGMKTQYSFFHSLGTMQNRFTIGVNYRNDHINNDLMNTIDRKVLSVSKKDRIDQQNTSLYANEVFRFSDYFRV